jgi:hypothetical protein
MGLAERCAIGFARFANTKPGLVAMLSLTLLVTLWLLLGGHRMLGTVFLLLSGALGAQLWRTEGGHLGPARPPTPPAAPDPA